ncbi:MAG: acyl-CoA dehydrogenase family protein [Pseudomonadota bacterium]
MIGFSLTEEQKRILEVAREFSAKEIRPVALQYDKDGAYPEEILKKAHKLGFTYTKIPKEYGGLGLDYVTHAIVTEALNYDCCAIGSMIGIASLATGAILLAGTDEQKKKFLSSMTASYRSGCFCLTEPEAGSDAGSMKTVAEKKGDSYVINGTKCFITNGQFADLRCLFATKDRSLGIKGICCFAIPNDTTGVSVGRVEDKMGQRALNVAEVIFENVELSKENLIGQEGEGFKLAMMTLDSGRVNIAAVCTAIAQKALDEALHWARERKQFGQPIGNFQGVHFMLADMNALVTASRLMYLQSSWMLDQGIKCSVEAATAKCFASDAAMKVTTDAVQILGGSGYMKDSLVEKLMRDAKLTQIYEGTNQINRIVSGRGLLSESKKLF